MDLQITTITRYRTPEGKEFATLEEAKEAALHEWLHSIEGVYLDSWKAERLAKIMIATFDLVPKQVPIPTVNLENLESQ